MAAIDALPFTGRSGPAPYPESMEKGIAMNVLHRLAWASLALLAGCVPASPQQAEQAPPAPAPARAPAVQPAPPAEPARSPWRWLPVGEPEDDDDEFEGEGWGFWGF